MTISPYEHKLGEDFRALPGVHQIELTNHCNLKCPMCLRTTDMVRAPAHVDIALIKKMIERGDLEGTEYTELQMAGEPTLHPQFKEIVWLLKSAGVLVGTSTHGLLVGRKPGVLEGLLALDAVTISVDSVDPEVYARVRYPAKLDALVRAIDTFVTAVRAQPRGPFVELQLIDMSAERGLAPAAQLAELLELIARHGWGDVCTARVHADCFTEMQGVVQLGTTKRSTDLCVNPWMSVSVTAQGSVVSCCYIFEPDDAEVTWYGDLNTHSLRDIWAGRRVQEMRTAQRTGTGLPPACTKCYMKSPTLIHKNIVARLLRNR